MAKRGKHADTSAMFVADFETCEDNLNSECQRVWFAGIMRLSDYYKWTFTNLEGFIDLITSRAFSNNNNIEIAFHNLKFDGSYIVPYLFKAGFTPTHTKPQSGEFSALVDNRNNWYNITIQVTSKRKVTIWDSLKLFPTPLEYLPNIYSTPTHKLQEDSAFYEAIRTREHVPTEEEEAYLHNDLQVLAEVLNKHIEINGLLFKKTQASQSFENFTQGFKSWKLRFPPLSDEIDKLIRPAYWGGIAYVPPVHAGHDHFDVGVYDINSSYPDKAANKRLPYGKPLFQYGQGKEPNPSKFWVAEALLVFKLKPHHLPCIPRRALSNQIDIEDKWVADSLGVQAVTFCSIDWITMKSSYDIEVVAWNWSIHYASKIQKEIQRFVYKNNDDKVKYKALYNKESDPILKADYLSKSNRAKIDNNSFYGKFGEDIEKISKYPELEDDFVNWYDLSPDIQKEGKRKYLPVAMVITAYGRQQLVQMANTLGKHFLYCDTDSIHYSMKGHHLIEEAARAGVFEVDDVKLGAWKFEGRMKRGRYLRAKCYMEETEQGHNEVTLAGLPADPHTGNFSKSRSCVTWDNFRLGAIYPPEVTNKLRTVRTPTGNKLIPTGFQISEKEGISF